MLLFYDLRPECHVLAADADPAAPDLAVVDEGRRHELRNARRYGEADALRGQHDCAVDADDLTPRVDQRSTRVARVQCGVRLDDVVDEPAGAGPERPAERAHDAGRDRTVKAEGVPDGNYELSHAQRFGIAQLSEREVLGVDLDDGKVGVRIIADDACRELPAIIQRYVYLGCLVDDVAVRKNKSVRREYEA
jgi:hypothetical protein